jgi:hypothetical protein
LYYCTVKVYPVISGSNNFNGPYTMPGGNPVSISQLLRPKSILAFVLTFAIASLAYGFAAANTFAALGAGDTGVTTVSGYTVEDLKYVFDITETTQINEITFTLNPTEALGPEVNVVKVWINGAAATVDGTAGGTWTATLASPTEVELFLDMRVVAYNQAP